MSKNSGTRDSSSEHPKLVQWTRTGLVPGAWGAYDTLESLVFSPELQTKIQKLALGLLGAQDLCLNSKVPWRRGAFLFGPAGSGKSAITRAVAMLLGWTHFTIPEHEIVDTNHLSRALSDLTSHTPSVVVLENIDELFKRIEVRSFVDIFDSFSERLDGVFWLATTRHPEDVPKNQLVRPGRFEESLRLAHPEAPVKRSYYETYVEPLLRGLEIDLVQAKADHLALIESNEHISFAHLQEMRLLMAKVLMDGDPNRVVQELTTYCQEQVIGSNRWGFAGSRIQEIEERVRLTDPRLLASALQVTDAFKRVVEMTVGSAAESLAAAAEEGKAK